LIVLINTHLFQRNLNVDAKKKKRDYLDTFNRQGFLHISPSKPNPGFLHDFFVLSHVETSNNNNRLCWGSTSSGFPYWCVRSGQKLDFYQKMSVQGDNSVIFYLFTNILIAVFPPKSKKTNFNHKKIALKTNVRKTAH
jgi:hypothetical protein